MSIARLTRTGAQLVRSSRVRDAVEATEFMRAMAANPRFAFIESNAYQQAQANLDEPLYTQQCKHRDIEPPVACGTAQGNGVIGAVLDSEIAAHSKRVAQTVPSYDVVSAKALVVAAGWQ